MAIFNTRILHPGLCIALLCGILTAIGIFISSPASAEEDLRAISRDLAKQIMTSPKVASMGSLTLLVTKFQKVNTTDDTVDVRLQDKLISAFDNQDKVTVIERAKLDQALAELKMQSTSLVSPETQKKLGNFIGANYLIVGNISEKHTHLCVDMRLIDISTAVTLATASYDPYPEVATDGESTSTAAAPTNAYHRKRIAVLDFTVPDSAISIQTSGKERMDITSASKGISAGLTDMLVTALVNAGNFEVIERAQLEKILQEHGLDTQGEIDPATAAKAGKILGVDYILGGSVTQFSLSAQNVDLVYLATTTTTASVAVDVRMVDPTTAAISTACKGVGKVENSNTNVLTSYGVIGGGSTEWTKGMMGEATRKAVDQVVSAILEKFPLECAVLGCEGNDVYLSLGRLQNINIGDQFRIVRLQRKMLNGKEVFAKRIPIGTAEVVDISNDSCQCKFSASDPDMGIMPKEGDIATFYAGGKNRSSKNVKRQTPSRSSNPAPRQKPKQESDNNSDNNQNNNLFD
ncbi:MAG TPA: FlgO family outer membrane protein [Armatimonadota bacterium]|nr:FlgO family outer membrane protein [Armatimonadota bacterium]